MGTGVLLVAVFVVAFICGAVIRHAAGIGALIWVVLYEGRPLAAFYDILKASNWMENARCCGTDELKPGWEGYEMQEITLK